MQDALARALADNPVPAALLDEEGTVLACDSALSSTLRRPVEETVGHTIWALGPSVERDDWLALRDRARREGLAESQTLAFEPGGASAQLRLRVEALAGDEERYLLRELSLPTLCDDGCGAGDLGQVYRCFTDQGDDGYWAWQVGSQRLVLNRRWREMAGLPSACGEPALRVLESLHPENHVDVRGEIERLIRGDVDRIDTRLRVRLADGRYRWFRHRVYVAMRHPGGRPLWLVGHDVDITDQVDAEAESAARVQAQSDIFERLPIGVFVFGADGRPQAWNHAGTRLLSRPDDALAHLESLGHEGWALVDEFGEPLPPERVPLSVALRTGRAVRNEIVGTVRAGRLQWLLSSAVPSLDARGRVLDVVCTAIDITQTLESKTDFAYWRRLEILGRLAGGVAHDFNNLLTVVATCAELLAGELAPGSAGLEDIAEIQAAAARGARLTRDLLGYARRQLRLPARLDLRARLPRVVEALCGDLPAATRLILEADADLWPVDLDPEQLDQVVGHLVSNAADALKSGRGTITIEARNAHVERGYAAAPAVARPEPGDYVVCTVRDDGRGMSPEIVARATDPFFTTKPASVGSGLGLSSCLGITRQNGGQLVITSAPGQGTTVEIWLPRAGPPDDGRPALGDGSDPPR